MTEKDQEEFARCLLPLASNFRVELSSAHAEAFWMAVQDLPLADVKAGIARAITTCTFIPTGFELRKLCGAMTPEMRAIKAWDAVKRAVSTAGSYRSVDFSDPAINATIRSLGGWVRICLTDSGDDFDKWLRKEFERTYLEYVNRGSVSADEGRYLAGILETEQNAHGYPSDPPRRIGVEVEPIRRLGPVARDVGPDAAGAIRGLINDAVKGKE